MGRKRRSGEYTIKWRGRGGKKMVVSYLGPRELALDEFSDAHPSTFKNKKFRIRKTE